VVKPAVSGRQRISQPRRGGQILAGGETTGVKPIHLPAPEGRQTEVESVAPPGLGTFTFYSGGFTTG